MRTFFPRMNEAGEAGAGGGGTASTQSASTGAATTGTLLSGAFGAQTSTQSTGTAQAGAAAATGSGVVEPYYKSWLRADGTIDHSAYDRLPEHLKPAAEELKKYGKVDDLLGSFWHAKQLVGKKGLMALPDNATPEAKAEFNARLREILRVPEKPEGYGVKKPDGIPDDVWNSGYVNGALQVLHKHNVPPEAVKELVEFDFKHGGEILAKQEAAKAKAYEDGVQELRTAFGQDFDKRLNRAQRVARTFGLDVDDPAIGNNPKIIAALDRVGASISEDKLVTGASDANRGQSDKEQAEDIQKNPANPLHAAYRDANHPGNAAAVAKVNALWANWSRQQKKAG